MKNNEYFTVNNQYCVHIPTQIPWVVQIADLTKFYEPYELNKVRVGVCPLLQGHTVKSEDREYRVERIHHITKGKLKIGCRRRSLYSKEDFETLPSHMHCYVFIDISINQNQHKNPFAKTPSRVVELINAKKIIITNNPWK